MKLAEEERFALYKLFGGESEFDLAVISQIENAEVIERRETGVGYFSTIRFSMPLPESKGRLQWDWNFNHRNLKHGGSFIAFYDPPNVIELEAVVHDGGWPMKFDSDAFVEA